VFYRLLRQFGVLRLTVAICVASILVSILITALLTGGFGTTSTIIAVVVPALIAPFFAYTTLNLAYRLHVAEERLRQISITDDLTQAYNRRYFVEMAERALVTAKRYGDSFSIVMFDIDDFKRVNDTYGHASGDKVLITISELCRATIRGTDVFARYGGEEFAFLVPRCSPEDLMKFAERIRIKLSEARVMYGSASIPFTVSIGTATYNSEISDIDTLLLRADTALYTAKRQGKNQVVMAG
jgi:diguanylate cyclase (GGDEF)-like protein